MKTLLVLAPHPELADAIRAGLNPEQYRVVHRTSPEEAEPLLAHALADLCVLDLELTGVQGIWVIEKLRRKAARCPMIVYTGARQADWEEEAYLQGVKHVLHKPCRPRLLETLLDSVFNAPVQPRMVPLPPPLTAPEPRLVPAAASSAVAPAHSQNLEILRDFSAILTHSLKADALLKEFLLMIREITGVNRSAIFLAPPVASFLGAAEAQDSRRLTAACAIGLSSSLLSNVDLSFDAGIGAHVQRSGRILRRNSPEAAEVETQREFELVGAQVAVPILDRERVLGVAVFDARITGEPLANPELELIFHLLEQVGLAVKNIWLHDQVAGNQELLADVMRELGSACVVVSRDLAVLHANRMARKYFGQTGSRSGDLEFSDLPPLIGSKVFQVLKTGSALLPFRYTPEDEPGTVYQVTIAPVHHANAAVPSSVLLIVEDRTQSEQLQKLEMETSNLRLVRQMSDRLAAEIGNALVPISVHQQLLSQQYKDPDFRESLSEAMFSSVKRIERRQTQMLHVAREGGAPRTADSIAVADLIKQAWQEALHHLGGESAKSAKLKKPDGEKSVLTRCDAASLKFALMEIILNGLQAGGANPVVSIQMQSSGAQTLELTVVDNGPGFAPEAAKSAGNPFYTTKVVGLGLGLFVARRIVEAHGGKLLVAPAEPGQPGRVQVSLPVEAALVAGARVSVPLESAKH